MDLLHLIIADYANMTGDGKLNVMGIFSEIAAARFPARHPEMFVIAKLRANPAEYGQKKTIKIKLLNDDGEQLIEYPHEILVPQGVGGKPKEIVQILCLKNIIFKKAGAYQFSVLVDNDEKGSSAIYLVERATQKS